MKKVEFENEYWMSEFIPWLRGVGIDPRNGECIDTYFWFWYMEVKCPEK